MKQQTTTYRVFFMAIVITVTLFMANGCSSQADCPPPAKDSVAANIKVYSYTWDEIMNKGKLDMFYDSNFTKDVVMHVSP